LKQREIISIIEAKYQEYAQDVIQQVRGLGRECRQSGDDSGLKDVWEEFKSQVQGQESAFFHLYQETIRDICGLVARKLSEAEFRLLWLLSDAYTDREEEGFPALPELTEDVVEELYSTVVSMAMDEEIEIEDGENNIESPSTGQRLCETGLEAKFLKPSVLQAIEHIRTRAKWLGDSNYGLEHEMENIAHNSRCTPDQVRNITGQALKLLHKIAFTQSRGITSAVLNCMFIFGPVALYHFVGILEQYRLENGLEIPWSEFLLRFCPDNEDVIRESKEVLHEWAQKLGSD